MVTGLIPTQPAHGQPTHGGQIVNSIVEDAKPLQPLLSQDTGSGAFISLQYAAGLLVDELYQQGAYVPGCAENDRKPYYEEIQRLLAEDQPYLFLGVNESLGGVNKRIVVNQPTALGIGYEIWKWHARS